MEAAEPVVGKTSRALPSITVLFAALFMVGYSLYGVAAPLSWGHHGFHIGQFTLNARNTQRFGDITPSNHPGWRGPPSRAYYMHHPPAFHLLLLGAYGALGESEWVARALAIALSLLTLAALVRVAAIGWGWWGAAGAAVVFAFLPYMSWFSIHVDEGIPSLFGMLMGLGSYLRYRKARTTAAAAGTIGWLFFAGAFDWSAYMLGAPICVHALAGGLLLRRSDRSSGHRLAGFALLLGLAAVLEVGLHFLWTWRVGALREFMVAFSVRTAHQQSYRAFFELLVRYGDAIFTRWGLWAMVAWLVLFLGRLVVGRARMRDVAPFALFVMLGVYTHLLKSYVQTHIYLLKAGTALVALASVDVASALGAPLRSLGRAWASWAGRAVSVTAIAALAFAMQPAWWKGLHESRARGGIPLWAGGYNADAERLMFGAMVNQETAPGDLMLIKRPFAYRHEFLYYTDRDIEPIGTLAGLEDRRQRDPKLFVIFQEPVGDAERPHLASLLREHPALRVNGMWMVDLRSYSPGVRSYTVLPSKKRLSKPARFLTYPKHAKLVATQDPWKELEIAVGFGIAPSPDRVPPVTLEAAAGSRHRLLQFHNLQRLRGDAGLAAAARDRLLVGFDVRRSVQIAPSARVAGTRWDAASGTLALVWECTTTPAPFLPDTSLYVVVRSRPGGRSQAAVERAPPAFDRCTPGFLYDEAIALQPPPSASAQVLAWLASKSHSAKTPDTTLGPSQILATIGAAQ